MTKETSFGVARLRQAITNQATCGSGQFELSIDSADRLCRECEDELARLSWAHGVPAPVDADGEVVPLDTKGLYTDDGEMVCVNSIRFDGYSWEVRNSGSGVLYPINMLHRTKRDSWERLEEDVKSMLRNGNCAYFGRSGESCEGCQAFAIDNLSCSHVVVRDVALRAKALAERDAKEADR